MALTSKIVISGLVAAILSATVFVVMRPAPSTTPPQVGAVSSPDEPWMNKTYNRQKISYLHGDLVATSSVVCSFGNPTGATSTLLWLGMRAASNGLGSQTIDVATSTTAYGTTSPMFIKKYATGTGQFSFAWTRNTGSTTPDVLGDGATYLVGNTPYIIGPSEYINFKIASGTAGTYSSYYSGTCDATLLVL